MKRIKEETQALVSRDDLTSLAKIYKTDKWGAHAYTPIYDKWFRDLRHRPVRLLEIGVGGFTKAHFGGNSLRMWKRYFPKGRITGIDIYDKTEFEEKRIRIYTGDQADAAFLEKINRAEGPFDIIIDDGSHNQSDILASLATLFPLLKPGGIYVIEDTQTSYWERYEGSTSQMKNI
ncbi:MAG TPA: class I SAM-dependent methyltransferase, partial [Saprospiraceae bacterium]|nr:class I SAM-dependent methyltransferase [Saprospiraceae bacterium]